MNWTPSETLALAAHDCASCLGLGIRLHTQDQPCPCVLRAVFQICYARFRQCAMAGIRRVSLETGGGLQFVAFKHAEYMADFCLVAKRVLGEDSPAHLLFKFHFLLGADWRLCCRKLGLDRGSFFHEVYRIESRLGRAFVEIEPHALFPLDEYFGSIGKPAQAFSPIERSDRALRPPLKSNE